MDLAIAYLYLFGVLGAGEGIRAWKHYSPDFTRKAIHIGVGFWAILAYYVVDTLSAALIPPASFILVNLASHRFTLIKAMEIEDRSNFGTVWYPLSICILLVLFWGERDLCWVTGTLVMALGDGFASIVGQRRGKRIFKVFNGKKSLEGSAAMFVFSCLALAIVFFMQRATPFPSFAPPALAVAGIATAVEAASPRGTDNLTVPLASACMAAWLLF